MVEIWQFWWMLEGEEWGSTDCISSFCTHYYNIYKIKYINFFLERSRSFSLSYAPALEGWLLKTNLPWRMETRLPVLRHQPSRPIATSLHAHSLLHHLPLALISKVGKDQGRDWYRPLILNSPALLCQLQPQHVRDEESLEESQFPHRPHDIASESSNCQPSPRTLLRIRPRLHSICMRSHVSELWNLLSHSRILSYWLSEDTARHSRSTAKRSVRRTS